MKEIKFNRKWVIDEVSLLLVNYNSSARIDTRLIPYLGSYSNYNCWSACVKYERISVIWKKRQMMPK